MQTELGWVTAGGLSGGRRSLCIGLGTGECVSVSEGEWGGQPHPQAKPQALFLSCWTLFPGCEVALMLRQLAPAWNLEWQLEDGRCDLRKEDSWGRHCFPSCPMTFRAWNQAAASRL